MIKTIKKNNKGYTLLFAVIVSSIVLSIGISVLTISKKEFLLSSAARDSSLAFYAADSGIECAAYRDQVENNFSTSSKKDIIDCGTASNSLAIINDPNPYDPYIFEFSVKFGNSSQACAKVTVKKEYDTDGLPLTTIDSRGYNLGWDGNKCDAVSVKKVERGLQLSY